MPFGPLSDKGVGTPSPISVRMISRPLDKGGRHPTPDFGEDDFEAPREGGRHPPPISVRMISRAPQKMGRGIAVLPGECLALVNIERQLHVHRAKAPAWRRWPPRRTKRA